MLTQGSPPRFYATETGSLAGPIVLVLVAVVAVVLVYRWWKRER